MKNLKVSMKLIVSFLVVVSLAIIVGVTGIIGMNKMNDGDKALYNGNYLPTVMAGDISQIIVEQRVNSRNFVIYDVNLDAETFNAAKNNMQQIEQKMEQLLTEYKDTIVLQEDQEAYDEFVKVYKEEWLPALDVIYNFGVANQTEDAKEALNAAAPAAEKMNTLSSTLQSINIADGQSRTEENSALFLTMTVIEIVVLVIAIVIALGLAFYISKLIAVPVAFMKDILNRIGTKGDMDFSQTEYQQIEEYARCQDEIGESVGMLLTTVRRLVSLGAALQTVADGDLTSELALLSERDTMGLALRKMNDNLNNMFGEISNSTSQVSTGSKQIADGSQALAQGATEQAAAVEQLSSSIAEIAEKTKENATMAEKAATLANTIKADAEKGTSQMGEMMTAVKEINEASQSINKVIKVIDDIAFQTNILALNAAVEAARAGQHGKGFAVVAEEVRNLAAKSAEAAKDTGSLIANSIEKAELGARIADNTATSLNQIVSGINESTRLVSMIAKSSDEQALGISQINKGIDQVAQVVQQNSATAEESAAASEEMSGQSDMLQSLVAQFKTKNNAGYHAMPANHTAYPAKQLILPEKDGGVTTGNDFGKY